MKKNPMDTPQLTGLIRRAQGGNALAFAELVDLHYDTVYRFAWKWCGQRADAEDIAQQACMKLAQSIGQYRFHAAFTSWLYRLVVNCALDWQRAQRRHRHSELPEDEPAGDSGRAEDAVLLDQLLSQLDDIGEGMRETALLVHAEGLSHAEAGAILGVSESTISWRIHTMRKHMNRREAIANSL
jgi:RNA polymerase sigma-70 factor (ECF subfamily)